jgi:hypothetical protein
MRWWIVRALSVFGLLLGGGVLAGAAATSFSCFDVCPADLTSAAVRYVLFFALPRLAVAGLGWARCLALLGRGTQRWRVVPVLVAPAACLAASAWGVLAHNAGHLFPLGEGEITSWERAMTGPLFYLPAWSLVTLLATIAPPRDAPPDSAGRAE